PGSPFAQARGSPLAGALVLAWAQPGPGDQMSSGREAAHVAADLGEYGVRRQAANAGDRRQAPDQLAKGWRSVGHLRVHAVDLPGDLSIDLPDRPIERIPLLQMQLQQKAVVLAQPAMQRIAERFRRGFEVAL